MKSKFPDFTMKFYICNKGIRRKGVSLDLFDDIVPFPNQSGPIIQAVGYRGKTPTHMVLHKKKLSLLDWTLQNATPLTDSTWTYLPSKLVLNSLELMGRYNDYLRKG